MRKIGLFNIGRLGLVKSAGTGKTDISKVIEEWVKEHMVFWYDMSKPVDTYSQNFNDWRSHPSVNADIIITSTSFVITRFATLNDTVKCYIPDQTKNFPGMKVEVKGIVDGQELYWGYSANVKLVNITSDGTYDIPPLETVNGNLSFRNGNIVGACNITITQLPSGQSVPTNEILKANPYLQDFSGNNRPLKLNNFLFAAMSGVGGYELNWTDQSIWTRFLGSRFNGAIEPHKLTVTSALGSYNIMETKVPSYAKKFKVRIDGIVDETVAYKYINASGTLVSFDIKEDGEYELPSNNTIEGNFNMGWAILVNSYPHTCNITIEQIPSYPNALVTDGVDDYGVVQNLQQGVKVLFYTCNPFSLNKILYDQTKQGWRKFNIYNQADKIAYNERNENGVTYIDGNLNSLLLANDLVNKKQIITIVNDGADESNTISPIYFSVNQHNGYFANLAFYNSIGFDSVPTKQNDGFTEQDLIDYYIPKAIVTITVVDVSGSPIQDATVTVGGVQYKTLSDGTVKVRGMVNGTMSLSVKKDGYMPFSDNSWKLADSRITLEVLRNTVITENGYSILLENDGLILTE
mgnify:CR=1 FL=1|jgi:hypothetical protein